MAHLLCLGDSITDAGRLFDDFPLGNGYVSMLSQRLAQWEPGFSVTNCGVDGFTVKRLLADADRCLSLCPDIITILIGINDIGLMMNTDRTPEQQKKMMADFFFHYRLLLDKINTSHRTVILMEPFIFSWPARYRSWFPFVETMSQGIQKLAEEFRLPYIHLHHLLNEEARRYGLETVTTDGIHLTAAGHGILAQQLFYTIQDKRGTLHEQQDQTN